MSIVPPSVREVWNWFSRMGAPIVAALLIGWIGRGQHERIDDLKATIAATEAEKTAALGLIEAAGRAAVNAGLREQEAQTALLSERERFYAAFEQRPVPAGACLPDLHARERVRGNAEAASRFALGDVQGGPRGAPGDDL